MEVLAYLIPISLLLGGVGLVAFVLHGSLEPV